MWWLRWIARKFWLLVVLLVIGLALLVQAGRILSPQVANYQPQISSWLSNQLAVPVQMQHISLRWQALEITLQIDGLKFGEAGEVKLGRGLFHLDLLASLWNRELVWKNLEVDDFSAALFQRANGGWQIAGFPHSTAASENEVGLSDPMRIFQLGPKIQVRNARIGLHLNDGQTANLNLPHLLLENGDGFNRLTARAFVSGPEINQNTDEEAFYFVLEGRGNPRDPNKFALRSYLQFNELLIDTDLMALINQLSPLPEKYFWTESKLTNGRLWLEKTAKQGYQVRGQLNLAQALREKKCSGDTTPLPTAQDSLLAELQLLSANFSGHWLPGEKWQLALQDLNLQWRELNISPFNLLATGGTNGGVELALDQLDLAAWHPVLNQLQLAPQKTAEWLQALEPKGRLENIHFAYAADDELSLSANLHSISTKAYRSVPAVSGVNGYLQLKRNSGWVQLNSNADFSAHFPELYSKSFAFEQAQGTVAWEIDNASNSVAIFSGPLQLDGALGQVSGQFLLQLPSKAYTKPAELTLALGLKEAAITAQRALVPDMVSKNLRDWLQHSLGDKNPGWVSEAGFIYRGYSYNKSDPNGQDAELLRLGKQPQRQTVQTRATIRNAELDYASGWPKARNIDAQIKLNDLQVVVNARKARLWSVDAEQVQVLVSPRDGGSQLDVRAQLSGPAADGLKLLQQSPLREHIGSAFDQWKLHGDMRGELTLTQPLGKAKVAAQQSIDLQLNNAQLTLKNPGLKITELSGPLHYDSQFGLRGSQFNGNLWGLPLSAKIQHMGKGDQRDTQIIVAGHNLVANIQEWSGRPELNWLNGEFDYTAQVTIPAKAKHKPYVAVLEINSDLHNVAVNLPAPLGKTPEQKSRFVLRVPIGSEGNLYHLSYGEHLQGQIWQVGGKLQRASIALNAAAQLPQKDGIVIFGDLSQIEISRWREALAIYTTSTANHASANQVEGNTPSLKLTPLPISLDISTDQLLLGAATINNFHLRGRGHGADWQLQFDSETAAGELTGVFNTATPLQLNLEYLQLPALPLNDKQAVDSAATTDKPSALDLLQGFDFSSLPLLDFSTKSLRLGDSNFGPWSFRVRPSAEQLVLNDISGSLRGIAIEGLDENKLGAQLIWSRDAEGVESSQFIGRLRGGNLGQVLEAWGEKSLIESESASFDTAFRWDGSPAQLSVNALSGSINIDIKHGRFLRTSDNAGSTLLSLLSLFNFDTWARRLRLDFSDLVQSGLTFDRVHGEVYFEEGGELSIAKPIQVEGPSSALKMAGKVNLKHENLNLNLSVTLPVGNNLALVAALAGGLPAAAGVYLISKVFKKQVNKVASVSYRISGNWADPQVRFDKFFDDSAGDEQPQGKVPKIIDSINGRAAAAP